MIEGVEPYSAYKESGVPWLGLVPSHWDVSPFRAIATARKGRQPTALVGPGDRAGALPYLSMEFLRSPSSSPTEFAMPQDDLVIAESDDTVLLWDGANAGEFLKARTGAVSST
jgi:type I restriction enzyme S subunit